MVNDRKATRYSSLGHERKPKSCLFFSDFRLTGGSKMTKRSITLIIAFSLLTLFPSVFARVGISNPTFTISVPDKSRNSSCPTCQAASQKNDPLSQLDNLSTLGRRTQVNPFVPLRKFDVNLVGTSSGDLGFGVTDLYLSSLVPVAFARTYLSSRSE